MAVLLRAGGANGRLLQTDDVSLLLRADAAVELAGIATGSGAVDADLTRYRNVEATAAGAGTANASLSLSGGLDAITTNSSAATGSLALRKLIAATATGVGDATATLPADFILLLNGDPLLLNSLGGGILLNSSSVHTAPVELAASAVGAGTHVADLHLTPALLATATGTGSVEAEMGVGHTIEGVGTGAGAADGVIAARGPEVPLRATAAATTETIAPLVLVITLNGSGSGAGAVAAELRRQTFVRATTVGTGIDESVALGIIMTLAATTSAAGDVLAFMPGPNDIAAEGTATGSATATLAVTSSPFDTKDLLAVPSVELQPGAIDPSGNDQDYFGGN